MLDAEHVKTKLQEFAVEAQKLGVDILPWEVANTALLVQLLEKMPPENLTIINMLLALHGRLDKLEDALPKENTGTWTGIDHLISGSKPVIQRLQEDTHTSIMIAFMLDQETAEKLAIPGGEAPEELHVTLCYMGDKSDFAADKIEYIKATVADFAADTDLLSGHIGGIGRFTPSNSSENLSPVVALVNIPGLQLLHGRLIKEFYLDSEICILEEFDYMPHITLCYIDPDAPMPVQNIEPLPLAFDTLWLCIGDERISFKLGEPLPPDPNPPFSDQTYSYKIEMIDKDDNTISDRCRIDEVSAHGGRRDEIQEGAQWIIEKARSYPGCHIAIMGESFEHVHGTMIKGLSGIIYASPRDFKPEYKLPQYLLAWPNGSKATICSASEGERLRGMEFDFAWGRKGSNTRNPEAWEQLKFRLRKSINETEPKNTQSVDPELDQSQGTHEEESTSEISEVHEDDAPGDTATRIRETSDYKKRLAHSIAIMINSSSVAGLTDHDQRRLTQDLAEAYLSAQHYAYSKAMRTVGINVAQESIVLSPRGLIGKFQATMDDALAWAKEQVGSITATMKELLGNFIGGLGSGVDQATAVRDWLANFAGWKSEQIANVTWQSGLDVGTNGAIDDILEAATDPEILPALAIDNMRVKVLPAESSKDDCADYAGNDYGLEEYNDLGINFPFHLNCPHYAEIYMDNGNSGDEML